MESRKDALLDTDENLSCQLWEAWKGIFFLSFLATGLLIWKLHSWGGQVIGRGVPHHCWRSCGIPHHFQCKTESDVIRLGQRSMIHWRLYGLTIEFSVNPKGSPQHDGIASGFVPKVTMKTVLTLMHPSSTLKLSSWVPATAGSSQPYNYTAEEEVFVLGLHCYLFVSRSQGKFPSD